MTNIPDDILAKARETARTYFCDTRTPLTVKMLAGYKSEPPLEAIAAALLSERTAQEAEIERLTARVAELEAMTEWNPINTAPLNKIVDVWCIEDGSPASCGNNIPSGKIIHNRHKSEKYGWFGNQSNDGVPRGHMPDMIPVAWRHRSPDAPIAIIEAFIAARAALTPAKENADAE